MMQLDRLTLGRMAKELGFVRDTLEKVCRLADVLKFFESDNLLSEAIALKGGTAINLTIFNLPRLSVDIDLDYCRSIDREDMLADREIITDRISKYMHPQSQAAHPSRAAACDRQRAPFPIATWHAQRPRRRDRSQSGAESKSRAPRRWQCAPRYPHKRATG